MFCEVCMSLTEFFTEGIIVHYINAAQPTPNTIAALWVIGVIACVLCAYLLGSLNFAIIISGKTYKDDIRNYGSKNAGMTNMMRTYGKRAAAFTLLGDSLKAVISGLIGYALSVTLALTASTAPGSS